MNTPLNQFLAALEANGKRVRRVGQTKAESQCPGHDDRAASLSVAEGNDGRVLVKCHAGCTTNDIVGALGMVAADLFPPKAGFHPGLAPKRPAKCWPTLDAAVAAAHRTLAKIEPASEAGRFFYPNASGAEWAVVVRFDHPTPAGEKTRKSIRPFHRVAGGWAIGDPLGGWPLYRLSELAGAKRVYICEGEKAADAAVLCGLPATTSSHGAKSAGKTDWTPLAKVPEVVILPDHDNAGEAYARDVAALVGSLDPKPTIRILRLVKLAGESFPSGGDFADFSAEFRDGYDADVIRTEIEEAVQRAEAVEFESETAGAHASEPTEDTDWTALEPLPEGRPPVEPFDYALLPVAFAGWVEDITDRMQCPPDYVAITAMVTAGAAIGRRLGIRPKRKDDWLIVPNLWGCGIGRPGLLKSPAMAEPLKPLRKLESDAGKEHADALKDHETQQIVAEQRRKVDADRIRKAIKGGGSGEDIASAMANHDETEPVRTRYLVNDPTVEKLGEILRDNPAGVLLYRDELIALLRNLDREGQESSRGFYLEAWNGNGHFAFDRIGRGTVDIDAACISILGSIQPGPLSDYLRGAVSSGAGNDGLMQRFQLAVWPDTGTSWVNVDRYPNGAHREAAWAVFARLVTLTPESVDAERDDFDADAIPFLRFSDDAEEVFLAWRTDLEKTLRSGTLHEVMEAHLSKYRKLIPALALIIHLVDGGIGPVAAEAVHKAIRWDAYLQSHARRIYAGVIDSANQSACALGSHIQSGDLPDGFSMRDVYRPCWAMLSTRSDAQAAVDVLTDLGWLREESIPTAGRTAICYRINPKVARESKKGPGSELTKLSEAPSVSIVSHAVGESPKLQTLPVARQRGEI